MFTVITDTSANLPTPQLKEREILALPFTYAMEGKEYTCEDTEAFDGAQFFGAIRRGTVVNTSQINPQTYENTFRKELEQGKDVVFVSMSSGISGSCNSARVASRQLKEEFPDRIIEVVDTTGASLGEGFIALHAADLRDQGMETTQAAEVLRQLSKRMCNIFTVDDLMHLRRTGRCSNITAVVGTVLNIKPLLKGDETGHIVTFGKLRGRRKALDALVEIYNQRVVEPENQVIGIAHADCLEDAEYLMKKLREKRPPKDIQLVMYEPVTGSHVGPDTLALFFLADEDCRLIKWPLESRLTGLKNAVVTSKPITEIKNAVSNTSLEGIKNAVVTSKPVTEIKNAVNNTSLEDIKNAVVTSKPVTEIKNAVSNVKIPSEIHTPIGDIHLPLKGEEKEKNHEEAQKNE